MSSADENRAGLSEQDYPETPAGEYDVALPDIDLGMNETDPAIIDEQIRDGIAAYGGSAFGFVNNFFGTMPGGYKRRLAEETRMLNRNKVDHSSRDTRHSEEFSGYSFADFFEDIDEAIERAEIDLDELASLQDAYAKSTEGFDRARALEVLCHYIVPVYRELRIMGYSHYDLWG